MRPSAKVDYDPRHYRFQREQSRLTQNAEWEERVDPLEPMWRVWTKKFLLFVIVVNVAFIVGRLIGGLLLWVF